jgi:hypothetical protein
MITAEDALINRINHTGTALSHGVKLNCNKITAPSTRCCADAGTPTLKKRKTV